MRRGSLSGRELQLTIYFIFVSFTYGGHPCQGASSVRLVLTVVEQTPDLFP